MSEKDLLIDAAKQARENAHAPYSNFRVGAALRSTSGRIFSGCNVENATYGLTMCAERVAIFKAISEGERGFSALAVVTDADSVDAALRGLPPIDLGILRRHTRDHCEFEGPNGRHADERFIPPAFRRLKSVRSGSANRGPVIGAKK